MIRLTNLFSVKFLEVFVVKSINYITHNITSIFIVSRFNFFYFSYYLFDSFTFLRNKSIICSWYLKLSHQSNLKAVCLSRCFLTSSDFCWYHCIYFVSILSYDSKWLYLSYQFIQGSCKPTIIIISRTTEEYKFCYTFYRYVIFA